MFEGQAAHPEGPVGAGIDSLVIQDGKIVTFAAGVTLAHDYELQGIRTLGFYGDRYFKSMGYNANFSIDTFVLRGENVPGRLNTMGWQWDGRNTINTAGLFDFVMMDLHTLEVLFTMIACKFGSEDIAFPNQGLNTRATHWRATRILPGLHTS